MPAGRFGGGGGYATVDVAQAEGPGGRIRGRVVGVHDLRFNASSQLVGWHIEKDVQQFQPR